MRPKNLKFPFTWEERRPVLHEGVLIIPQYYHAHKEWEIPEGFYPNDRDLMIEYCSGNGDWIVQRAQKNPHQFWIAVEKQFRRVRKIWSKMCNQQIENLLIVCGEALTFTRHYLFENRIMEAYVNFPDPWPKEKQAKHRLVQEPFVAELHRVIKKGGKAVFATDDQFYSQQMIEEMLKGKWTSLYPSPYYVHEWEGYGNSWFETLWREKGKKFYYMQFEKWI